ncbi:organophosphate reductase [Neocallimastix californiae]|jgi:diketogulonate reductase-like aldo/keto reductase|uniref:Organophosphate reductase n=1 Tax=Neocallimastix californiae TaxID=1754190 RepID=A0A1Y2A6R2_9FUNG|nr:organophosphate reductase [Neocallimastix californiae]|eukprot:ORY17725.1 organophosphate reductase [Neocallimastix californiae]
MEFKTLANGIKMPMVGLGVFKMPVDKTKECVLAALKTGYRLIDTAQTYKNEKEVGKAIRESGIPRKDIFVTTKIWLPDYSFEGAQKATKRSLDALGLDYIDLMLIHQPMGDYIGAWRGLEKLYKEGACKAIGMSNCFPNIIADICETVNIKPMVNQVEMHPFFQQELNIETMKSYGIVPEAWAPLNEGKRNLFRQPILTEIGKKYGKTAAQVALRWNIQRGVIVIPKSDQEYQLKENIDIFDFKLSDEDMKKIATMDIGHSEIVDLLNPKFIKYVHNFKY